MDPSSRQALVLSVAGHTPRIAATVFLAPGSVVAGDVTLEDGVSVWFGTVVRAEREPIFVGADTNLQDGTVVHVDPGFPARIGRRATVGHRVILHGCTVGDDALIGMGAIVLTGAVIGEGAVVGAGAVVTEGMDVPPRTVALGIPAKVRALSVPDVPRRNVASYLELADWYRQT